MIDPRNTQHVSRWPSYCIVVRHITFTSPPKVYFCIQQSFLLQLCSLMNYFQFTERRLGTLNTSFLTITLVNLCQIYHVIYFATSPSCTSHLSPQGLVSRSWAGWYTRGANGRGGISCRLCLRCWSWATCLLWSFLTRCFRTSFCVFFRWESRENWRAIYIYISIYCVSFLRLSTQPSRKRDQIVASLSLLRWHLPSQRDPNSTCFNDFSIAHKFAPKNNLRIA